MNARRGRTALLVPLALLPLLAACAESTAERAAGAAIDTLAGGAVLVRNGPDGAWNSASAWRLVEVERIGSIDGPGPDVFGDVHDLAVDEHGRVWVLDAQQKRIEVFDAAGRHVRTVGRPGGGPGELEHPTGIEFDPRGRLWVEDPGNARYTVFDSAGAPVATYRRDSMLTGWIWEGGITSDGRVFGVDMVVEEGMEPRQVLFERDSSGAVVDTFELPAFDADMYEVIDDGRRMMAATIPYSSQMFWRLDDDATLWFGETGDYRIVQRTLEGDTLRVIEKEWTPIPITRAERDSAVLNDFYDEMRARGANIDPARIPSNKPAWTSFWLDADDHLWVAPLDAGMHGRAADAFDPDGVYLGRVALPDGFIAFGAMPIMRGDRWYAVVRDELGVPYVVIGRIAGRDAGE